MKTPRLLSPSEGVLFFLFAGLFFFASVQFVHADVITLNNGDELSGTVVHADSAGLEFFTGGATSTFSASQMVKVEFESLRSIPGEETIESIKDPLVLAALKTPLTEKEFPEASLVDILDEDVFDVTSTGTWVYTSHHIFTVLKEKAREEANHAFSYFPDIESQEIVFGRSITPPGEGSLGSVRYVADRTIADEAENFQFPQYQRQHTVKFAIPEVNKGTIVDRMYRIKRIKADSLKPFHFEKLFRGFEPKQRVRLVVRVPDEISLNVSVEERDGKIIVERHSEGGKTEYSFTASNTTPVMEEPSMPDLDRTAPRVILSISPEWKQVASSFAERIAPIEARALESPDLKAACDKIVGNATEPDAKARALFGFVSGKISLVNVDPNGFTHEPLDPVTVLHQRQGNLLDKSFLYHCLLKHCGVDNRLALIRPWDDGNLATSAPALTQLRIMAVEIPEVKGALRLNVPESEFLSPDIQPAFLQGGQGIVLPSGDMISIPLVSPDLEGVSIHMDCEIHEDGTLFVHQAETPYGNSDSEWRKLKSMSADEIRKLISEALHEAFPGAKLLAFEPKNLDDVTKQMSLITEFSVPDYVIRSGTDLLAIPIPVEKSEYSAAQVGIPVRQNPMSWETLRSTKRSIRIKLPKGYTLHALPDSLFFEGSGFLYRSSFGYVVDRVLFKDEFRRERNELSSSDYPVFKRLIELRAKTADQWIIVKKG
ncbi:MAG: DUF3857 domain-containing protein [Candidatus Ozemobacteraceae bacterium]